RGGPGSRGPPVAAGPRLRRVPRGQGGGEAVRIVRAGRDDLAGLPHRGAPESFRLQDLREYPGARVHAPLRPPAAPAGRVLPHPRLLPASPRSGREARDCRELTAATLS